MRRPHVVFLLAFGAAVLFGCREPLEFDLAYTADEARGKQLIRENCANTCHPADAFTRPAALRKPKNFNQLAYTIRDYYEQVVGEDGSYSQQDIFDMSRYLNRNYYHFHAY